MRIKRVSTWAIPLLVIVGLAYLLGYSSLISVKFIELNDVAQREDIQKIINRSDLNIHKGAQLARVNVRGADSALKAVSWVANAKVSRNWFSGKVRIFITARTPVAKVVSPGFPDDSFIDLSGKIFQAPGVGNQLPLVTIADSKLSGDAASFITKIPGELISQMTDLTLSGTGQFEMQLDTSGHKYAVKWGSGSDLAKKIEIFNRLISLPENKKISAIDLSDPKYPIVKN